MSTVTQIAGYYIEVVSSNSNVVNACISFNGGYCVTQTGNFAYSTIPYPFSITITTTSAAACSQNAEITLNLRNAVNTGILKDKKINITIINPVITGNINFCGATTNTFSGSVGSATVSINKSGWAVNGQTPPVTTSNSSFTVTSPGGNDNNVTMTINGSNYCAAVVNTLRTQASAPSQLTDITYATIYGCEYSLSTNNLGSGAYQYEWAVNSNFSNYEITTINTTTALPGLELEPCISTPVYVRARNSCGISNAYSKNISFPSLPCCQMTGCCGYGDQMNGEDKEFNIVYNRETNRIHIEYIGEKKFAKANIIVMSAQGRVSEKYQMNERTIDLTDNCLVNGLNLIKVETGAKCHSFKLLK